MTHTPAALIIGGGIVGPAAAMALQQAGIDSVIHEAHPTGAEGIGVFLTLGSNEGRIAVPPRARCRDGQPCLPSVA